MHKNNTIKLVALIAIVAVAAACDKKDAEQATSTTPVSEQQVVAYVNKTPVTRQQVENLGSKLFGDQKTIDENLEKILIESLVGSRAMALLAEKEMTPQQTEQLQLSVDAYKEELLMKQYLQSHVEPQPVTAGMVKDYYDKHPEEFSGGIEKTFEYITNYKPLTNEQRKEVLNLFKTASEKRDWQKWVNAEKKLPLTYKKATANVSILEEPLKSLVKNTRPGEISPVHIVENITLVRVVNEKQHSPKPLAEVSQEIRKKLAPIKLRDAIKQAKEKALEQVDVAYPNKK